MKKLLQFTSIYIFTMLLCFLINPAHTKADTAAPATAGIGLQSGHSTMGTIAKLHTADLPAALHIMNVCSSSGIDSGNNSNREYLITFNANYGTISGKDYETTVNHKLISMPTAYRSGYTFRGWYTQASGGTLVTLGTSFSSDTNVYAQWDNFDAGFRDFYVSDISDTSVNITALIPQSTYVRTWGISYGTSNAYLSQSLTHNLYQSTSALSTTITGLMPNTTYYFRVYYIADVTRMESRIGSFYTTRTTEYIVSFYPNGGTVNGQSAITTVNQKLPYMPTAYREGYTFDGWYTGPYDGALITTNNVFRENSTVYAHWTNTQNNSTSNPPVTPPANGSGSNGSANGTINNGSSNNGSSNNSNINNGGSSTNTDYDADDYEPVSVQKVKLKSVKNTPPRRMKVTWNWYAYGDGYQIAYSTNKKFAASKTKRIFAGVFTDAKTIAGLKKGKTYYVRVRAYQKSGGKKYYGAWSNVKKVKIKK